jgi:hypothetical protein
MGWASSRSPLSIALIMRRVRQQTSNWLNNLLQENGDDLLQEDGSYILLE